MSRRDINIGSPSGLMDTYPIDRHHHAEARCLGKSGDQSGNNWGTEDSLTLFRAISGSAAYGADANDEAKVLGSDDTPVVTGKVKFDLHKILVVATSATTAYIVRLVWGTGTMAAAITAGQYSTFEYMKESAAGRGAPLPVQFGQRESGTKVWVQVKSGTNNATFDFLVELHEYER